jgi:RimJ/RimL family protein N-acetyltransferase
LPEYLREYRELPDGLGSFGRLYLDRVVATTMADNIGSWRVLEKCGLRRVCYAAETEDRRPGHRS